MAARQPLAKRRKPNIPQEEPMPVTEGASSSSSPAATSDVGARRALSNIMEHYKCPITQQLLVDPVVAEDGHTYERRALSSWLLHKKSSPATNEPMGLTMIQSLVAQQTISELVEQGLVDADTLINFLLDRGRFRCTHTGLRGPDLVGATADFTKASDLAKQPVHKRLADFQLKVASWMKEGVAIFAEVPPMQADCAHGGEDFLSWVLDYGSAARAAITVPFLESRRMTRWQDLEAGARVKVIDDASELQRLCERPPPEAEEDVGWNDEMVGFAGRVCIVQRMGEATQKDYVVQREHGPAGRPFSFPYNALYLLAASGPGPPRES